MSRQPVYVVAGCRPWSRAIFTSRIVRQPGQWHFVEHPRELSLKRMERLAPRRLFFLHWSWRVPAALIRRYECIGFHMTDLPYGRGGSPLQHLILRGHRRTRLTAFRMGEVMDAGPIYLKRSLGLQGRADAIYQRVSRVAAGMIRTMNASDICPAPQRGRVVMFQRRTPALSRIPRCRTLERVYDVMRMLDAEGYPRAFVVHEGFRYTFTHPKFAGRRLTARVSVSPTRKGRQT